MFNNIIEAVPRYMEYSATLAKGGSRSKAIWNAAEVSVNFSRNGEYTKLVDSFIIYMNPGVQGIDKMLRQVGTKPVQSLLKSATIVTAPMLVADYVNKDNPN